MALLTSQHVGNSTTNGTTLDFSYNSLNASTTKIVVLVSYTHYDSSPVDASIASASWDNAGTPQALTEITGAENLGVFAGDRFVAVNGFYHDSPNSSAGTLRIVWPEQAGIIAAYVHIYEFDSEADSGFGGSVGTHVDVSASVTDPSITISTRDSDSIILIAGTHQVNDANPFTPGTDTVEDLDADVSSFSFFAGHEPGTGGSDTISYTQTIGRRNAATAVEVEQTVGGDPPATVRRYSLTTLNVG